MVLFDHGTSLAAVCTLPRVEIVKEFEDWIVVALLTPTEQNILTKIQANMFRRLCVYRHGYHFPLPIPKQNKNKVSNKHPNKKLISSEHFYSNVEFLLGNSY